MKLKAIPVIRKQNNDEEHRIQKAFVTWWNLQYCRKYPKALFAVPNGGKLSGEGYGGKAAATEKERRLNTAIKAKKLKAEGMLPGVADLFLSIPSGDYAGMYIETKTPTGDQSDEQKAFEAANVERGYAYIIMRSPDEGIAHVTAYLEGFFNQQKYEQCLKSSASKRRRPAATQKPKPKPQK